MIRNSNIPRAGESNNILEIKHIFGANGKLRNSLHFIKENSLVYMAGNNMI